MNSQGYAEYLGSTEIGNYARLYDIGLVRNPSDLLEVLPVMPSTVFGLEVLLQETPVDLRSVTELVMRDVGAVIHVLRLFVKEYGWDMSRPTRIAQCIAGLDLHELIAELSAHMFSFETEQGTLSAVWKQRCRVAQCAYLIAEARHDVHPEDAYLLGLLDDRGAIVTLLGLRQAFPGSIDLFHLLTLEGFFPVANPFVGSYGGGLSRTWSNILDSADELACAMSSCEE